MATKLLNLDSKGVRKMIESFNGKTPKIARSAFVCEAARVIGNVEIGGKSSVWPGAVLRGDFGAIKVGRNTSVEDNCVIHTRDETIIGDNAIIGHGAKVHCRRIGNNSIIGMNATLLDEVEIGEYCIIGAGSVVAPGRKIPAKSLVMGVPARIRSELSPQEISELEALASRNAKLAQEYKKQGL